MSNTTGDSEPKLDILRAPSPSNRVGIKDPDFVNLTAAEKLNDSNYRKLVYQAYPDERTCACQPVDFDASKSKNSSVCRPRCKSVCSSRPRQPGGADEICEKSARPCLAGDQKNASETKKVEIKKSGNCSYHDRLRGGGEGTSLREFSHSGKLSETLRQRLTNVWDRRRSRLEGGVDVQNEMYINLKQEPGCTYEETQNSNFATRNKFRASGNINFGGNFAPAACCCPGKETLRTSEGQKPLQMADNMVKAFQETQEFVDSLGKVPGLTGLGLMDPSDSPYFRRTIEQKPEVEGPRVGLRSYDLPNPQCTGPCNARTLRSDDRAIGGTPFTIDVPGRGGIVREAIPVPPGPGLTFAAPRPKINGKLNETAQNEEALVESGPCGEPSCGSRKRKPEVPETPAPVAEAEETPAKTVTYAVNGARTSKTSNRMKTSRFRKSHGPADFARRSTGRRSTGRRRSSVKKIINFVYSAGDHYGAEHLGHKKCVEVRRRVPWNMGWLWNQQEQVGRLKPRRGWRPGAIGRRMIELLAEARARSFRLRKTRSRVSKSSSSRSGSAPSSRGKRSKFTGAERGARKQRGAVEDKKEREPPPTLYIHRKDGTYYVTMYPIKQETMDVPKLEEPMKPLQFKIARNRDDASDGSSSTASDMEIEFSPPAAVNRYKKKPNVIHAETQVKQQDILDTFKPNVGGGGETKSKKKAKKDNKKAKKGKKK